MAKKTAQMIYAELADVEASIVKGRATFKSAVRTLEGGWSDLLYIIRLAARGAKRDAQRERDAKRRKR